jgi:CBS domain-containing protein
MSRPVVRVGPDTPVTEAAQVLVEHGFSALPVVEDSRVVGIVTEADLVRARIPAGNAAEAATRASTVVGEVMTRDPVTRTTASDVADVVGEMLDRRLRVIPLVDDGALVGILARRDVLRCVAQGRLTSVDVWRAQVDLADRERG